MTSVEMKRQEPAANLLAGGVGGLASLVIGHPFDTVKVRLQTMSGARDQAGGLQLRGPHAVAAAQLQGAAAAVVAVPAAAAHLPGAQPEVGAGRGGDQPVRGDEGEHGGGEGEEAEHAAAVQPLQPRQLAPPRPRLPGRCWPLLGLGHGHGADLATAAALS